jgi:hypothetical protein
MGFLFLPGQFIGVCLEARNLLMVRINDQRATVHTMTRRLPWSLT